MSTDNTKHSLSVVVPVRDEENNLEALYRQMCRVLDARHYTYEIIIVDDASTDGSWQVLKKLRQDDSRLKIMRFAKHYGQTAALAAGFSYATADIIVTLDADLQNDPADIPLLLSYLKENCDLVVGWRRYRQDPVLFKILPSQAANFLIRLFTGLKVHDIGCTFKVFKRSVIDKVVLFGGMHRFLPLLAYQNGCSIQEMEVSHYPRRFGKSKYGLERIVQVVHDMVTLKLVFSHLIRARQLQYVLKEVIV